MRIDYLLISCLFISLFMTQGSDANPPLPKGTTLTQLDNGMRVLLIENPALPMIGVNVIVKVGSAYETHSTSGMSHMLEHLLFNGTTSRSQKQLYDDVDRIGGYNNASTADFYTNYMMVTPTEHIKKGMEIQADMLFNSTIPSEKFEKEKGIVLEEISKSLASPPEQMERNTIAALYPGHALSLSTLGTYSTIQSMTRDSVSMFYKNYYVPNNMMLTVIGNFKTAAMIDMLRKVYGKAKQGVVKTDQAPDWATAFGKPSADKVSPMSFNSYDGEDKVLQLFFPLPQDGSSELFELIGFAADKEKDALQSALNTEFPRRVKSLRLSTRLSHLGNYLEATVITGDSAEIRRIGSSLTSKISEMNFKLPDETVSSEVTKQKTEFYKNIEKPHMFGIYNSNEIVRNGFEGVLGSIDGLRLTAAAKQLESFTIDTQPVVLIQNPTGKKGKPDGMRKMMMPR